MDWSGCELVERIPGKVSGRPLIKGTRILADTIVEDYELGSPLEEIRENFPAVSMESIKILLQFAETHRAQLQR